MVHFRKKIDKEGMLHIFAQSIELQKDKIQKAKEVITDTTVQEKTSPTQETANLG